MGRTLFAEWQEARQREASGMDNGTRSTYIEWLGEQQVLLLRQILASQAGFFPNQYEQYQAGFGEGGSDEPEDQDGADPV